MPDTGNNSKDEYIRRINEKKQWAYDELREITKNFIMDMLHGLQDTFDYVNMAVIEEWYESYQPHLYKRKEDLYNVAKYSVNGAEVYVDYDYHNMKKRHRASNEYIYYNSFIRGYHGGADSFVRNPPLSGYEEKHPNPGIPYWRWPPAGGELPDGSSVLRWQHWFGIDSPAEQTFSPFEHMDAELAEQWNKLAEEKADAFIDKIVWVIQQYSDFVSKNSRKE